MQKWEQFKQKLLIVKKEEIKDLDKWFTDNLQ